MKKGLLVLTCAIAGSLSYSQPISTNEFLELSSLSPRKLENYIEKKGFIPAGKAFQEGAVVDVWQELKNRKKDSLNVTRKLSKYHSGNDIFFCFQTSSRNEHEESIAILKSRGFICGSSKLNGSESLLFQRKNVSIHTYTVNEDTTRLYCLLFHQLPMPAPRSVIYADDLLQFSSHEHLAAFFGERNVSKDVFFFSDKEQSVCSVLYPNSPRQVVFIWKDEVNLVGLRQLIISGNLPTAGSLRFNQQLRENDWLLADGIHFNMRLDELLKLNGIDFSFYGKDEEYSLMVLPQQKGEVNFKSTGIVLDCINCDGSALLEKKTVSAADALTQDLRMHIGMIILMPSKEAQNYTSWQKMLLAGTPGN